MKTLAVHVLIHVRGCGKPAYFVEEYIAIGMRRPGARAVRLDMTIPRGDEVQVCGSCHRRLGPRDIAFENLETLKAHGH